MFFKYTKLQLHTQGTLLLFEFYIGPAIES